LKNNYHIALILMGSFFLESAQSVETSCTECSLHHVEEKSETIC